MIVRLTPEFKFVCDRCGREKLPNEENYVEAFDVAFCLDERITLKKKRGQICQGCFEEFWEIADNFFNEVNKWKESEYTNES